MSGSMAYLFPFSSGYLWPAVVVVLSAVWCWEIFQRRERDLALVRESDEALLKGVIVFFRLTCVPAAALGCGRCG